MSQVATKKKRKKSPRGNWLVVSYRNGKIWHCQWVQTWTGAQMSKRNAEKYIMGEAQLYRVEPSKVGRVLILDIERMMAFSITEAADEINDLYKLWEK